MPAGPVVWPGGARAAASFTFDVDAESGLLFADASSAGRMSVMSHQAYGPLVGVPRLLALLARQNLRATFFVPGFTADRWPDALRAIVDAGHEVAHHGYLHETLTGIDPVAEAAILDRGVDALERITGTRPTGYRAPMWELTWDSPRLLVERGFRYDSSLMDADVPYRLAVGDDSLVELPVQWALDDWEQYCYVPDLSGSGLIESPTKALEIWTLELDALHSEGGLFVHTSHPFLSGRPSRARALEQLVERAADYSDLWLAPLGEIAAHVETLNLLPRTISKPTGF